MNLCLTFSFQLKKEQERAFHLARQEDEKKEKSMVIELETNEKTEVRL